ncbi:MULTISPECIES: DUF6498-containing protein [Halorubrum]|uniref:Uncharacterized protein n=1 Tax=Halorubrum hochstenium ATCC 700873 TaxID=1227481 RepID=M0FL92_9EURY|nr:MULTISPECIES: DUF6498-containing protein [Halorubrum]ELZ59359.1 hypothetical protein C467_03756 [Halorubrum hochstenium ATCC 700873]
MASPSNDSPVAFLVTVAANVAPLIGVFGLGWSARTFAVVYAIELVVALPFAGVKALFARRPPNYDELERPDGDPDESDGSAGDSVGPSDLSRRRGSVPIADALPPIYLRNVPFASRAFGAASLAGAFLFVLGRFVDVPATLADPSVAASVVFLVVSHVGVVEREYFRTRRYETTTPRDVVASATTEGTLAAAALMLAVVGGPAGALVAFVAVKLFAEWRGYRGEVAFDPEEGEGTLPAVAAPDASPTAEVRPDRRAVRLTALWRGAISAVTAGPAYLFAWVGLTAGSARAVAAAVVCFGLLPAGVGGLKAVEYALTHGTLRYQRRADAVVAYDGLTETVQWTTPADDVRDAELCEGELVDRARDTRTFSLTAFADEYDLNVAHLREYGRAVEAFDLPVETTAFGPLDRRVVGAAVAVGACGVAAVAGLAASAPSVGAVAAGFGGPFGVVGLRRAWRWALPAA